MAETKTKAIRPEKIDAVREIKEKFQKAKIAIFTDYQRGQGLPVKEVQQLRRNVRATKGEFKVVKNTLAHKALIELKLDALSQHLQHATAIAFGYDDPASTAKALFDFAKEHKASPSDPGLPVIKIGWMDETVLESKQVHFLATLPPKPVLLSQLAGNMKAPLAGMVNTLSGVLRGFVTVLEQVRKQKESTTVKEPAKEQKAEQQENSPVEEAQEVRAESSPSSEAQDKKEEVNNGNKDTIEG